MLSRFSLSTCFALLGKENTIFLFPLHSLRHFRRHQQSGLQTRLDHYASDHKRVEGFKPEKQWDLITKAREIIRKFEATFMETVGPGLDGMELLLAIGGGVKVYKMLTPRTEEGQREVTAAVC